MNKVKMHNDPLNKPSNTLSTRRGVSTLKVKNVLLFTLFVN